VAEYDTIAAVKAALRIPVVANGDIDSPEKARDVLAATGADAIMIGRAAFFCATHDLRTFRAALIFYRMPFPSRSAS